MSPGAVTVPTTARLHLIGHSAALERAASALRALETRALTVVGPHRLVDNTLEAADCVITDDPAVAGEVGEALPVVFLLTDDAARIPEGVTDVLTAAALSNPPVLGYRLHRVLRECSLEDPAAAADVSDVEEERALLERSERLQTVIENVPVILFVLDGDGVFTLSEGRGLEVIDLEQGAVVGQSVFDQFTNEEVHEDVRRALDGEHVHVQRTVLDRTFETWYRPIVTDEIVERVIAVSIDVTQRVQYEQTLSKLHEATLSLLPVDSKTSACEIIVDVATEVLELTSVAVYQFDPQRNVLIPAACSAEMSTHIGNLPDFHPNESITWQTFADGEAKLFDDVRTSEHNYVSDLKARSGLFVPMGSHGVLVAISSEIGVYDQEMFKLVQLLGATAEATLDRLDRTNRLHDRERELRRQNNHLERLARASAVRTDIEQLLLRATSREEIERGVCRRLTDLESCSFAWVGEPDPGGNQIRPRTTAGHGRGYLEAITVTTAQATEPTGQAARTRQPTTIPNIAETFTHGSWAAEALSRRLQSILAVPLIYDGFLYGVLSVYADEPNGFDTALIETLGELAEQIAYSIDAVTRKNALIGGDRTEIDIELYSDRALVTLAAAVETTVELEGALPQTDGTTVVFLRIDTAVDPERVETLCSLESVTAMQEREEWTLLRARVVEPFLPSAIMTHGGTLRRLSADTDGLRAQVEVPHPVGVRELLDALAREGWPATLCGRREVSSPKMTNTSPARGPPLLDGLTDRQREVVQTAYHGGFFEWPRRMSGKELAASLDISPPAFHNHIRTAERKLFTALFEE